MPGMSRGDRNLGEVAIAFLRLGTIAFGGPATHLAMMRDDMVLRRGWVSETEFVDAIGATSLLPGPGSTQVAMYLGRRRAGWAGLVVGGICFIGPAMVIVIGLAWAYVRYGGTVVGLGLLYGIKPTVVAIVAFALIGLGRNTLRSPLLVTIAAGAIALYAFDASVLLVLALGGAVVLVARRGDRLGPDVHAALVLLPVVGSAHHTPHVRLDHLWWEFLKLGTVVFGSGYLLLAFLRRDLVTGLGWLTATQVVDAISIGQLTPGPVFTTATFVGYLLGGVPGAVVATVAIFLPSFVMMTVISPAIPRLRERRWTSDLFDGIGAAVVGTLIGVTIDLAHEAFVDPLTIALAVLAFIALMRLRINSSWVVLAGALVGIAHAIA